jgi:DNA-binding MarR family transcriptional regulator
VLDKKEVYMIERIEVAEEILKSAGKKNCKRVTTFFNEWTKGLYVILRMINISEKEIVAGDIANTLGISTARVAVALATLERKKWIKKHKSVLDARKTVVELTDLGKSILKEREEELKEIIILYLNKLTDEEVMQLLNIIKKTL